MMGREWRRFGRMISSWQVTSGPGGVCAGMGSDAFRISAHKGAKMGRVCAELRACLITDYHSTV